MVKHALGESSAGGHGSQVLSETEGFSDGQVGLHDNQWSTGDGLLTDNNTSSLGQALIDTSHGIIWSLDLTH